MLGTHAQGLQGGLRDRPGLPYRPHLVARREAVLRHPVQSSGRQMGAPIQDEANVDERQKRWACYSWPSMRKCGKVYKRPARWKDSASGMPVLGVFITCKSPCQKAQRRMTHAVYCELLGLVQIAKPQALQSRGGFWFEAGTLQVHVGTMTEHFAHGDQGARCLSGYRACRLENIAGEERLQSARFCANSRLRPLRDARLIRKPDRVH